jgi:hypothetical protein
VCRVPEVTASCLTACEVLVCFLLDAWCLQACLCDYVNVKRAVAKIQSRDTDQNRSAMRVEYFHLIVCEG